MPTPWVDTLNITDPFTGWTPAEFSEKFSARYGQDPEFTATGGFASGVLLMDAIERTQSMEPSVISASFRATSTPTIYGEVNFNADDMYDGDLLVVQVQFRSMKAEMVLPTTAPHASLTFPMSTWVQKSCMYSTNKCSGHGSCTTDGKCECDAHYYGADGSISCETYCDGELAVNTAGSVFCKAVMTYFIGGLSPADRDDNEEIRAVIDLAVELVNNNTDGFLDDLLKQVFLTKKVNSISCSREAGIMGAQSLEAWASAYDSNLHGLVGPYCSTASIGVASYDSDYT